MPSRCIFSLFCLPTAGLRILKYTENRQIGEIYNSEKLKARGNGTSAKANNIYQYGHMLLQGLVSPAHDDSLRWPEPIYMRVGYVFDLRFSECKIQPISMIFGILNK